MEKSPIVKEENFDRELPFKNESEENLNVKSPVDENYDIEMSDTVTPIEKRPTKINYFLNIGNHFNIGIEENADVLIIEKNEEEIYTEKDLQEEYKSNTTCDVKNFQITNIPILLKYKSKAQRKFRYIIGIEHNKNKLLFLPVLAQEDVIISFVCLSYDKFDIIYGCRPTGGPNGYPMYDRTGRNMHHVIHYKRAEKGGWYKVQKNDKKSKVKATWITMLSGRCINQYDPDPDNKDFYYYHNPENGFNIKVPEPKTFIDGYGNIPKITEGDPGDFYQDKNGDIYIKIDEHQIDHIDSQPFDCRTHKLREVSRSTNAGNRRKLHDDYLGVRRVPSDIAPYEGTVTYRGTNFTTRFKTRIEAARFYDYYTLALRGVRTTNNNTLPLDVENDLLLYGVEKIPIQYRIKEKTKTLPVGISITPHGKYRVLKLYKCLKKDKTYETYEEAYQGLQKFIKKIEIFKEEERMETLYFNRDNYDDKYGYIVIEKDEEEYRIKLNIDAYKEFVHYTWRMVNGKPRGVYKGKTADLHIHVIDFYIKDYNRREMGTVDHRDHDPLDCTIEALRPATAKLQAQNVKPANILGFKGVFITGRNFGARYKDEKVTGLEILEDAAREYNKFVEKDLGRDENGRIVGYVNVIPENKRTTVKDLYSVENLTLEIVQDANVGQIKTILAVNSKLRKQLPDLTINLSNIKKENYEIVKNKVIEILKLK